VGTLEDLDEGDLVHMREKKINYITLMPRGKRIPKMMLCILTFDRSCAYNFRGIQDCVKVLSYRIGYRSKVVSTYVCVLCT